MLIVGKNKEIRGYSEEPHAQRIGPIAVYIAQAFLSSLMPTFILTSSPRLMQPTTISCVVNALCDETQYITKLLNRLVKFDKETAR